MPHHAVQCRCLRFRIYPEACKYISPPIYLSTFPRIHPPIPVYLRPSITCGLVMCTARDGPITRHLSRSASPFLLPFLSRPMHLRMPIDIEGYVKRGRCIQRDVSIERQIQRGTCLCVYVLCVFMWECASDGSDSLSSLIWWSVL